MTFSLPHLIRQRKENEIRLDLAFNNVKSKEKIKWLKMVPQAQIIAWPM